LIFQLLPLGASGAASLFLAGLLVDYLFLTSLVLFLLFLFGFGNGSRSSFVNNVVHECTSIHLSKHNSVNHKNYREHSNGINVLLPYLVKT
jgi:hypothetical protein